MSEFGDKHEIAECKAVGSTPNGIWVRCGEWDKDEFVPQKQIDDESDVWKEGDEGTLVVNGWLADQRGWR